MASFGATALWLALIGGTVQVEAVEGVADEMRLDTDEMLVLTLLQQLMLGRDLIAEKKTARAQGKQRFRDEF